VKSFLIQESKTLKDILISAAMRVLGAISIFVLNLVVANYLSINEAGAFFLCFSLFSILSIIGTAGTLNPLVRFIASLKDKKEYGSLNNIFNLSICLTLSFSIIISVITYFFSYELSISLLGSYAYEPQINALSLIIPFGAIVQVLAFSNFGLSRPCTAIFFQHIAIQFFLSLIIFYLNIKILNITSAELMEILFFEVFVVVVFGILFWHWNLKNQNTNRSYKLDMPLLIDFSRTIPKFLGVTILTQIIQWSGIIIGGYFLQNQDIALLSVSQRTAMLISLVLMAANLIYAPKFSANYQNKKMELIKKDAINGSRVMTILSFPILLIFLIFPENILAFFGSEYISGKNILRVLAIGQFVNAMSGSVFFILNMTGNELETSRILLLISLFSISSTVILTLSFGVLGCALATSMSVILQNLLAVYKIKELFGFNTLTSLFKKTNFL
jgi:O-antigen/teichoic acid export membrane protein